MASSGLRGEAFQNATAVALNLSSLNWVEKGRFLGQ